MSAPVLIMAGGTGGHVFPALAVAAELARRQVPVVWLGTRRGIEARLVPQAGIPIEWIEVAGVRGKALATRALAPLRLLRALLQALRVLRRVRPRAVLGMGGYAAGPGGLAAWLCRVPLVIHEQNSVAGMTNRWLARVANHVLCAFEGVFPGRQDARLVGNPVRIELFALPTPAQRYHATNGPVRLLVLGGSQGARALNECVPRALAQLAPGIVFEVRHQAGAATLAATEAAYRQTGVTGHVEAFIDDMATAYAWAQLLVCRAGALTVAELAAAGLPAVLVPFPYAVDDHQTGNAAALVKVGAAVLLPESELSPATLAALLSGLAADRGRLLAMAKAARAQARPDAAAEVAATLLAAGNTATGAAP
jgi:UDP-N-acetylglucosamine--N-acetylmuramyl-(pentapeptide) pyrophosphoryl-undecaprenol N-acetylglucosamine transferase